MSQYQCLLIALVGTGHHICYSPVAEDHESNQQETRQTQVEVQSSKLAHRLLKCQTHETV